VSRSFIAVVLVVLVVGAGLLGYTFYLRLVTSAQLDRQAKLVREDAARYRAHVVATEQTLRRGGNFVAALEKSGLTPVEAAAASAAAQQAFNLRQVRAGNTITVGRSIEGTLREIDYKIDAERLLEIVPVESGWDAQVKQIPSYTETVGVSLTLDDSLFHAVAQAGESPELALRLAQIFAYDLDFYTDPRKGDTFRVILEERKYTSGRLAGYGKIFAAEYENNGRKYQALLFRDPAGQAAYYNADGKSLEKMFLRSPLKFGAPVTSHFSNARFHPILKVYRAHLGTDYGAPIGTPVQSIGSGRVLFAASNGSEGNMVQIAHADGYETMYLHLSRIFVRTGEHIEIGKVIGLVGSTGLSTGPHLDFRISQKGQFKNFEKLGLPSSDPVCRKNWQEFAVLREKFLPMLKNPDSQQASAAPSRPGAPGSGALNK
jgi:murein DD-endopeptidase MepM/ murein hydrolase activator NlpD